jgi:hypothetical protein
MTWRSRAVLFKAGAGHWLVRDRTVPGDHPDGELAVVELTRDGFVVLVWTPAWSGVATVLSLPQARALVAAALAQRVDLGR